MAWRDNLQKASFRTVPFFVEEATTEVGRRSSTHHYPRSATKKGKKKQDYVWTKDLGAEADTFQVEGYVIQREFNNYDYFRERDDLIKALKTQGPGTLVHPFFKGSMKVSVLGVASIRENFTKEGGIAHFSMRFVQYNKPIFGQLEDDYVAEVDTAVDDMSLLSLDVLAGLLGSALAFLGALVSGVFALMTGINEVIASVKGAIADTIATATGVVSAVSTTIGTVLDTPCALGTQLKSGADSVLGVVGIAGDVIQSGSTGSCSGERRGTTFTLDGITIPEILGVSITDLIASKMNFSASEKFGELPDEQVPNSQLITAIHQAQMLGNAAKIAIRIEFTSQQQMEKTTEAIAEAMDDLLDRIGALPGLAETYGLSEAYAVDSPELFQAMTRVRAKFVSAMYAKNTGLTKEVEYTVPPGVISALELSYNRYDDITRSTEIMDRNSLVTHPGFLPNAEVISLLDE